MIALKNTTNNQIFYIIHKKMYGKSDGYGLTTLDVEYTENGQYSINPPSGYDGLSSVNVTVDVENGDCNLTTSTVTITGDGEHTITPPEGYDGFSEVVVNVESDCDDAYNDGVADQKAKLAAATFTENGSYNREDGWNTVQVNVDTVTPYNEGVEDGKDAQKALMTSLTAVSNGTYTREDGYNEVVVNVPSAVNNQNKQVTYTQNGTQTVIADSGYSGLGQVQVSVNVDTVTPYNNGKQDGIDEQKSKMISGTFTQNGTFNREDGYNQVVIDVDTVTPYNNGKQDGINEQKAKLTDITIVSNGHYSREDGYDDITVNVPSDINNQNKQITYTQNGTQTIVADNGYSGLGQVAVTVNVDTVTPYNNGFEDGVADQKSKLTTGTFTSNGTYVRPDGYNEVVINIPSDVHNQNKTVNPSTSQQVITANQGYSGLGQVTVNAVTASIDPDIRPENILEGVDILGVVGTNKGYDNGYDDGYADGEADQKAKLGSLTINANGTYSAEDGYGTVVVNVPSDYDEGYADGKQDGIDEQKAKLTTLTVTANGTYTRVDGYDEVIVNVQCGGSTLYVDPTSINTELSGGTYTINLYSSDPWTITNKPNWVTLSQSSGNGGIYSITVTIPSNSDDRSGSFTISNGSNSVVVSISQARNYGNEYLTFEAFDGARTIHWITGNPNVTRSIDYSFDGVNWTTLTSEYKPNGLGYETGFRIPYKGKVYVRGNMDKVWDNTRGYGCRFFDAGGSGDRYKVYGNIMSLLNGDNFAGTNLTSSNQYAFKRLFAFNGAISEAYGLILPNNTQPHCYEEMFLQTASAQRMYGMPNLPATVMTDYCYYGMFEGCSISGKPVLPSTQLAPYCYSRMFYTANLASAPDLPATTLAEGCYAYMFWGCRFSKAPDLLAETLVPYCYTQMFTECSSLTNIKCLAINKSATDCTKYWLAQVATSGTFTKNASATWTRDTSGIPQYWIVQNA